MLRMDIETFHWLAGLVRPLIEGKDTRLRKAGKAEVKLSLTLNYLAVGKFTHQSKYIRANTL